MPNEPLLPEQLRRRCDPAQFEFTSTSDLGDGPQVLGQTRASDAIRFGVGMRQAGYNLFVAGPSGAGIALQTWPLEGSNSGDPMP